MIDGSMRRVPLLGWHASAKLKRRCGQRCISLASSCSPCESTSAPSSLQRSEPTSGPSCGLGPCAHAGPGAGMAQYRCAAKAATCSILFAACYAGLQSAISGCFGCSDLLRDALAGSHLCVQLSTPGRSSYHAGPCRVVYLRRIQPLHGRPVILREAQPRRPAAQVSGPLR